LKISETKKTLFKSYICWSMCIHSW